MFYHLIKNLIKLLYYITRDDLTIFAENICSSNIQIWEETKQWKELVLLLNPKVIVVHIS